ncbi:hypothetical protein M432DRAFT_599988 [Thermoascus aurantiacus ATCC 26904]
MSEPNHRSQSPWGQHAEPSSSSNPPRRQSSHLTLPPLPQMRFPGDGFDFRRPVMSASPQTEDVIDLTNEPDSPPSQRPRHHDPGRRPARSSRPPRFGRNIMADVVDLEEEPEPQSNTQPPSSPEVQFVRATVRPPEAPPRGRGFMGRSNLLDMIRLRPSRLSSAGATSREEAFRQEVALRVRNLARRPQHGVDTFWIGDAPNQGIDLTIDPDVDVPVGMDYQIAGFNMNNTTARPVSTYKPPSPAPEGFTRTAQEDDVVVCPNCEDELGTGDEIKQQIWVAKPCGHVYCGECAKNRSLSKAKKAAQSSQTKTKPFAKCLVADCGKPVSAPKAMFQIYL